MKLNNLLTFEKLFIIYTLKSRGPRVEPVGTLVDMSKLPDLIPSNSSPHLIYPLQAQWPIRLKCISSSSLCQLLHVWPRSTSSTPSTNQSYSTVYRHVVFGQPTFLLPLGVQVNGVSHLLFLSIRTMCLTHFHLLKLTSVLIVFNF